MAPQIRPSRLASTVCMFFKKMFMWLQRNDDLEMRALLLLCPGSRFRHHFLLAGTVVLNFVASGANQTPILAYAIFCRQAQWLRHVVFKTPVLTIENTSFFRCRFLMAGAVL